MSTCELKSETFKCLSSEYSIYVSSIKKLYAFKDKVNQENFI